MIVSPQFVSQAPGFAVGVGPGVAVADGTIEGVGVGIIAVGYGVGDPVAVGGTLVGVAVGDIKGSVGVGVTGPGVAVGVIKGGVGLAVGNGYAVGSGGTDAVTETSTVGLGITWQHCS